MSSVRRAALALAAAGLAGASAVAVWRTHAIGPVQRGEALARASGCFACHGPGGLSGFDDEDGRLGDVPRLTRLDGYVRSEAELREWILDGRPQRLRDEPDPPGDPPVFRMPAFRGRLSDAEVELLVAYVEAISDFARPPAGSPAERGRLTALRLGCFQCHGPQGRGDTPNPGSLKGYVPSWSGSDFVELARSDAEIRDWIAEGVPPRLRANPVARFFLERQQLRMPAFGKRVTSDDLDALVAYIHWLRGGNW